MGVVTTVSHCMASQPLLLQVPVTFETLPSLLVAAGRVDRAVMSEAPSEFPTKKYKNFSDWHKKQQPLWFPGELGEGRKKEDVKALYFLGIDLDKAVNVNTLVETVSRQGWESWLHTTWNHTHETPRWRVVFPLSEPVSLEKAEKLLIYLEAFFRDQGIVIDEQCKNANRLWFYPPAFKEDFQSVIYPGGPLPISFTHALPEASSKKQDKQRTDQIPRHSTPMPGDVLLDTGETVEQWARRASRDEKLKVACPFHPGASPESAFVVRYKFGVHLVCMSQSHGHKHTPYLRWWQDDDALKPDPNLSERLRWGTKGSRPCLERDIANVILILEEDPRQAGRFWKNALSSEYMIEPPPGEKGPPRLLADADLRLLRAWLSTIYGTDFGEALVWDGVRTVAEATIRNPLQEYLESITWDGTPRIDDFFHTAFGAEDSDTIREVSRVFFLQLVHRACAPGCQADLMPILYGPQGIGKSTALRDLVGPENFIDTPLDLRGKDSYEALVGMWVCEFAELVSMSRGDTNTFKSFLTSKEDRYRPAYGRHAIRQPRLTCFVGTTNEPEFFVDVTGNRRFPVIEVTKADREYVQRWRDQLFAEAHQAMLMGELPRLSQETEQEMHHRAESYMKTHVVENPMTERVYKFLQQNPNCLGVTTTFLCEKIPNLPINNLRGTQMEIAKALRDMGYERFKTSGKPQLWCWHDPQKNTRQEATEKLNILGNVMAPVGKVLPMSKGEREQ